jgi:hypothetical protein
MDLVLYLNAMQQTIGVDSMSAHKDFQSKVLLIDFQLLNFDFDILKLMLNLQAQKFSSLDSIEENTCLQTLKLLFHSTKIQSTQKQAILQLDLGIREFGH